VVEQIHAGERANNGICPAPCVDYSCQQQGFGLVRMPSGHRDGIAPSVTGEPEVRQQKRGVLAYGGNGSGTKFGGSR